MREVAEPLRRRYQDAGWWTDETLGQVVDSSLGAHPDQVFRIWSDTRPHVGTYEVMRTDALRLVAHLVEAGHGPGTVVAFQMPNWWEAAATFYACALGGYVMVPIVHIYGAREVAFILEQSGARVYVSADRFGHVDFTAIVDGLADPGDLVHHVVVGDPGGSTPAGITRVGWGEVAATDPGTPASGIDPDQATVLAYTSGTTSDPKGVIHSHRTLVAEVDQMRARMHIDVPTLMGSPVTHATGMLGALLTPVRRGTAVHLLDRWDPSRVLEIMVESGIGLGGGASAFLASLLEHPDFTAEHAALMPKVGLGGAPIPLALAEKAAAVGVRITRAYGSTEHPSITGSSFTDPAAKRHATDGWPLDGVEIRLVDEMGDPVPQGFPGEIWSRGPDLCMGYTDPALTAEAFDAEGWYRTGDMGVLDEDGFLTITDRVKDVIIRGGENISAAEVEELLATMADVAEVAVVAGPDDRLGERPCAVIRPLPGCSVPSLEEIQAHLEAGGLARQKWPEAVLAVDEFPRTGSGKVRKVDLRRRLRDAPPVYGTGAVR